VAVAGDSLEVRDGMVYVNGEAQPLKEGGQYAYEFALRSTFNEKRLKELFDISPDDIGPGENGGVSIPLKAAAAEKLKSFDNVISMERQNHPKGYSTDYRTLPYFPNHADYDWTEDNFGPIYIPKKGTTVKLDVHVLPLYERVIRTYEHNDLEVRDGKILINGQVADSYTFKQDYYWLMGDNRHRSQDARFWGYVPHDHVVGKAVLVWFTKDPYTGIRWKRLFSLVK
jgi:signal peptidase I